MRKAFIVALSLVCLLILPGCNTAQKIIDNPEAQLDALIQKIPPDKLAALLPRIAPNTMEAVCSVYNVIHPVYDEIKAKALANEEKVNQALSRAGHPFDVREAFAEYEKVRHAIVKAADAICGQQAGDQNAQVVEAQRQGVNWDKIGDIVLTVSKIGLALL